MHSCVCFLQMKDLYSPSYLLITRFTLLGNRKKNSRVSGRWNDFVQLQLKSLCQESSYTPHVSLLEHSGLTCQYGFLRKLSHPRLCTGQDCQDCIQRCVFLWAIYLLVNIGVFFYVKHLCPVSVKSRAADWSLELTVRPMRESTSGYFSKLISFRWPFLIRRWYVWSLFLFRHRAETWYKTLVPKLIYI